LHGVPPGAAVAGAPKTGDKAAWGPRIALGNDTLYKHAIEGFQGKAWFSCRRRAVART